VSSSRVVLSVSATRPSTSTLLVFCNPWTWPPVHGAHRGPGIL
jgi:hypothetical protein